MLIRICITLTAISVLAPNAFPQESGVFLWPTEQWRVSPAEQQGFSSLKLQELDQYVKDRQPETSCLLVVRNGFLVVERYYSGTPDTLRDQYSITKSVISCLVGIAIGRNEIEGIDQPIAALMPSLFSAESAGLTRNITIKHLLTMTSGIDPAMSDGAGKSVISNVFQLPLTSKPGTRFAYSSLSANILSMVLTEKTGILASEYAKKYLFDSLGIRNFTWRKYEGYTLGATDLRLNAGDMARMGYLMLRRGRWDGKQLLSEEWVRNATTAQVATEQSGMSYGLGWWIFTFDSVKAFAAIGLDDQIICDIPDFDLVVVMTGGNEKSGSRLDIIRDVIIPSIEKK